MAIWCPYIVVIWYIFPMLVYCTNKNLATLICSKQSRWTLLKGFNFQLSDWRDLLKACRPNWNGWSYFDLKPGWPDGENFRLWIGYFLWDVILKFRKQSKHLVRFFPQQKGCYNCGKNWLGDFLTKSSGHPVWNWKLEAPLQITSDLNCK
jgi:hypothetical protein